METKFFYPGSGLFGRWGALVPLFLGLIFGSCDILRDSPFEVESWSPGGGYHPAAEKIAVSVLFSHEPDRPMAERAFSLTEDGGPLGGSFRWEGRRLDFIPALPLKKDRDYAIAIATDARDRRGLSLERQFEASFSTRAGTERPRLISTDPGSGEPLEGRRDLEIRFSQPVTVNSCVDAVSWSPPVNGVWSLADGGKTAIFSPQEPWKPLTRYRVSVSTAFTGANGLALEKEFSCRFGASPDKEPPVLSRAWGIRDDGTGIELFPEDFENPAAENALWEADMRLRLDFSEPVDLAALQSRLSVEPQGTLVLETEPGFAAQALFAFAEKPVYGGRFLIRLQGGVPDEAGNGSVEARVFRVFTGGEGSKPPVLAGIRLPLAPGETGMADQSPLALLPDQNFAVLPIGNGSSHFPYERPVPLWVELYFDTAPGAKVDLFSLMNLFSLEAGNNALSFHPKSVQAENFTWTDPQPGWESFQRVEIRGNLTNTVKSGMASFRIRPGLLDSRGNRNGEEFRLVLLK
jgi:hypothetical protein